MGSSLVLRAIARRPDYPQVSNGSYLILVRMAATALDHDRPRDGQPDAPARHYFAGWRPLIGWLGFKVEPEIDPTGKQAVARAIRELTVCGLVDRADPDVQCWFAHRVYVIRV